MLLEVVSLFCLKLQLFFHPSFKLYKVGIFRTIISSLTAVIAQCFSEQSRSGSLRLGMHHMILHLQLTNHDTPTHGSRYISSCWLLLLIAFIAFSLYSLQSGMNEPPRSPNCGVLIVRGVIGLPSNSCFAELRPSAAKSDGSVVCAI